MFVLGAGFDTRAYRFRELLNRCKVIEVDTAPTQAYKKRRLQEVLPDLPRNVTFCTVDFSKDDLMDSLRRAGFQQYEKTFYIWEGVCMYLPESSVRKMLRAIASDSAPGSTLVLDYANEVGIELGKFIPNGAGGIPPAWGERWIFGVPGSNGSDFFRDLGFDPGAPISVSHPEITRRYATRRDGTSYAANVLEKLRTQMPTPSKTAPEGFLETQKAAAAAGGTYWFTELQVMNRATAC
jgi:methyltransferase (TIGR00027 family)